MSVYNPLQDFLLSRPVQVWKASFAEIERILQRPLPRSAYRYQAWWANQEGNGHSQTAAWRDAGWRTVNLDLPGQTVEFEKLARSETAPALPNHPSSGQASDLLAKAAAYLGTSDETILYQEGLKALVQREAARRLMRLGGTMPDLDARPRRRNDEV